MSVLFQKEVLACGGGETVGTGQEQLGGGAAASSELLFISAGLAQKGLCPQPQDECGDTHLRSQHSGGRGRKIS